MKTWFTSDHHLNHHAVSKLCDSHEAHTAYLRALAGIVLITTLDVGDHGFDWIVEVPSSQLHEVTQQIVNIEYDIEERFNVMFRTFAKAVPG